MKLSVGLVETRSPTGLSINVAPEHSAGTVQHPRQGKGRRGRFVRLLLAIYRKPFVGEPDDMHPGSLRGKNVGG